MNEQLLKLCPQYPDDPLMVQAWFACLHWSIGEADARKAFEQMTGHTPYRAPSNALESMIDDAAGVVPAYVLAFAAWMTEHVWGDVDDQTTEETA